MFEGQKSNISLNALMFILSMACGPNFLANAWAQSPQMEAVSNNNSNTFECADTSIKLSGDSDLTQEEIIEQMDQALFASLSKYDACQNQRQGANVNSGGTSGGEPSSGGGSNQSVAANDMSGEEQPMLEKGLLSETRSLNDANALDQSDPTSKSNEPGSNVKIVSTDNGKVPDDIPPADNDSVLEGQIRQAAINEKDPKTRNKLWKEYRKYKGLPETK